VMVTNREDSGADGAVRQCHAKDRGKHQEECGHAFGANEGHESPFCLGLGRRDPEN
jgi:hypothetical protein